MGVVFGRPIAAILSALTGRNNALDAPQVHEVVGPVDVGNIRNDRVAQPHQPQDLQRARIQELADDVLDSMVRKFPTLASSPAIQVSVRQALQSFIREPVVAHYLFARDGSEAHLEGTPKGGLAPHIEFQKTVGSFVALTAMMAGVPIFGGTIEFPDPMSLEEKFTSSVRRVNAQFQSESGHQLSDFEPLRTVLAAHDVMKSADMSQLVQEKLAEIPVQHGTAPLTKMRFAALDHDAKLRVALRIMGEEVRAGLDGQPDALTRQFFSDRKIQSGEHKHLISIMQGMWDLGVNGLQLNQGECQPAQLNTLVSKAREAVTDTEFKTLQGLLEALSVHELTDLMGAANPFLPVLPAVVMQKAWSFFERLRQELPRSRMRERETNTEAAKGLYTKLLAPLCPSTQAWVESTLPNDPRGPVLVARMASVLRLDMDQESAQKLLEAAFGILRENHATELYPLLQTYGNLDHPIYMYYGPSLVENVKTKLVGRKDLSDANDVALVLQVLGKTAQAFQAMLVVHGGPAAFEEKFGADFINLREVCLAVSQMSIETLTAPENLHFTSNGNALLLEPPADAPQSKSTLQLAHAQRARAKNAGVD
jgi:hypothetical protein